MDQLAQKAQVPRATLYRHVGSKKALLLQLSREHSLTLDQLSDMRARILRAARQVFGRFGPANATMEQIAEAAGVGVATVYRHFGEKDQLVWAFITELSPRPSIRDTVQPSDDLAADLTALASVLLPASYEYRDILRFILTGSEAERTYIQHLRTGSDHTLDQLAAYFAAQSNAGRLPADYQPQELAMAFLGLILAFAVIGPNHYGLALDEPDRIVALIVQLFVQGLP
jgi:AcrR family transcriptional regulator